MKIEHLPNELLIKIMSYLPLEDRKTTRAVCKHWRDLSYVESLVKYDRTVVTSFADLDAIRSDSHHSNVEVKKARTDEFSTRFWHIHGDSIRKICLSFDETRLCVPILAIITLYCPNLEILSLRTIRSTSSCGCIEHKISARIPLHHLKRLELSSWPLPDICRELNQIWDAPNLSKVSFNAVTVDESFADMVERHMLSIRELEFDLGGYNDSFNRIIKNVGHVLTKLDIYETGRFRSVLPLIATNCPNLRQLGITDNVNSSKVEYALSKLKNMTNFALRTNFAITAETCQTFQNIDQLTAIDLTWSHVAPETIIAAFGTLRPNLIHVRLNRRCSGILKHICPNLPNLQVLALNNAMLEDDVDAVVHHNKKLECLRLDDCDGPSLNRIKSLVYLGLGNAVGVLRELNLPELERIFVGFMLERLTPDDIKGLVMRCPALYDVLGGEKLIDGEVAAILKYRKPSRRPVGKFDFWSSAAK